MMQQYAQVAELPPRRVVPVPSLTPKLSSHDEHDIARYVPDPPGGLTGYARAVELALVRINAGEVETRWSDAALSEVPNDPLPSPGLVRWQRLCRRAAGGVGLRRGRRNPETLHVGEALDWWRVEVLDDEGRLLRLRAEMKVSLEGAEFLSVWGPLY